jgi:hypothetical protein
MTDLVTHAAAADAKSLTARSGEPAPSGLVVDFCGEETRLLDGETLTFGRTADLFIDDNPYLHRRLGLIDCRQGIWWLRNVGSRIPLTVKDLTSRSKMTLAPGREMALTFPQAAVQFGAGKSNYELELIFESGEVEDVDLEDDGSETISMADLPLTADQRRLIVVLAEPNLRSGDATIELPTNKAAAQRLGWTITRFNRKLDNVCERLAKAGVSGLRGQVGVMASDRRTRLVEHSIESGLVTIDDLTLLEQQSDGGEAETG